MNNIVNNNKIINKITSTIFKLKKDYNEARSDELRKAKQLVECIENKNQQNIIDLIEQLFNELFNNINENNKIDKTAPVNT